jgi:hypothetical protein
MIYVTVPGDDPVTLTFRVVYDGCPYTCGETLTYETDAVCGTPSDPFVISLATATGINEELRMKNEATARVYDLQGRRISTMRKETLKKGVYVKRGKKVVVK